MLNEGTKVSMKTESEGNWQEGDVATIITVDWNDHTYPYEIELQDSGLTEWVKDDEIIPLPVE